MKNNRRLTPSLCLKLALLLCAPASQAQTLVAEAGPELNAATATVVTLDASQSHAQDGQPLRYAWQQIRGPKISFSAGNSARPFFTTPSRVVAAGQELVFRLTIRDAHAAQAHDQVTVHVSKTPDCAGEPPGTAVCQTPPRFNDTGINHCSDTHSYGIACPLSLYPGQDGDYGRDTRAPNPEDGYAGFSFTRLGSDGKPVNRQARSWACVRDNVTGLVWENKSEDGLHAGSARYDNLPPGQNGEHLGDLVARVNQEGLCGFRDWRVPSLMELQSLVNYEIPFPGPTVDQSFFPYTLNEVHWTASSDSRSTPKTWTVLFTDGSVDSYPPINRYPARLVRGTPETSRHYLSADGQEVTDETTGLVWKRCVEGMKWDGASCTGYPRYFTWYEALQSVVPGTAGWRVPNVKEMSSLIDPAATGTLAVNTRLFPGTSNDMFWTSTPYTLDTFYGWVVQSFYGYAYFTYLEDNAALRLVRDRRSLRASGE